MCQYVYPQSRQSTSGADSSIIERPRTLAEWFEYGRQCFHRPDGIQAVATMKKVAGLHPGYRHTDGDNPYYYLGKIHEVENRFRQAVVFYSRALAVDPLDEDSLIGRGSCLTRMGDHENAVYDFERLLRFPHRRRKTPKKHLFFMLAVNHRRMDRWGDAVFWGGLARDADGGDEYHQLLYEAMVGALDDVGDLRLVIDDL